MVKKHSPQGKGPQTGKEFVELAKARGAHVEKAGNFMKVSTPQGSMHIHAGTEKLDPQTRSNVRRWMRLLGLMSIVVWLLDLAWPTIRNILHVLQYG